MNKYNFKFALKIFAKNLVSKLFCFLLFFTFFMAVRGKIGSIITQVLDLVILTVIIFSTAFDFGEKEDVYKRQRLHKDPDHGRQGTGGR